MYYYYYFFVFLTLLCIPLLHGGNTYMYIVIIMVVVYRYYYQCVKNIHMYSAIGLTIVVITNLYIGKNDGLRPNINLFQYS